MKLPYRCIRCHTPVKRHELEYWVQNSEPIMINGVWTEQFNDQIDKPLCGPACAATVRGKLNGLS